MHTTMTLKPKDFRNLHNALCDMRETVNDISSSLISRKLRRAIEKMERALRDAYQQESNDFSRKNDHYEKVGESLGELKSIWSLYEVEDLCTKHSHQGAREVLYTNHWGQKEIRVTVKGHLWQDLWLAADEAISLSGDTHHIFIESFQKSSTEPGVLILGTGS